MQSSQSNKSIGKTALVYLGSAWVFIESFNFIINHYGLDAQYLDIIILLVIFGLPAAIIYAWSGHKFTRQAILLHSINLLLAIAVIGYDLIRPDSINTNNLRLLRFQTNQKKLAKSIRSVAILPFSNYSGNPDKNYLSSGIHDALISKMGQIGSIRVISRTSASSYSTTAASVQEIASSLKVDAIIEGSLLSSDSVIRVQVKLINAFPEEVQLWSRTYDATMGNLLNVYGNMVQNIADEINLTLSPSEELLISKKRAVVPAAYEAYLKGKYSMGMLSQEGIQIAMDQFQKAIELDPEFAQAYGGLGGIWAFLKQMDVVSADVAMPHITTNLDKALTLDSTNAEVYYWLAIKEVWTDFEWDKGEHAFAKALELNPNLSEARALYSHLLMILSRWEESDREMAKALQIDPGNPFINVLQAARLMNTTYLDSTIQIGKPLQKMMPTNPLVNLVLLAAYYQNKNYDAATEQLKLKIAMEVDTSYSAWIDETYKAEGFAAMNAKLGRRLEADDKPDISAQTFLIIYDMAEDEEKFLSWLERGFIRRNADMPYIGIVWWSRRFRDTRRFQEILSKMNLSSNSEL